MTNFNLSEQIKSLRKEKGISQEKLAQYLDISFQAVSKWENGNAYPDITLLPDIARFFGITVDELLHVEKLDEEKLYADYEKKAEDLFRNGKKEEGLEVWLAAYKEMPNSVRVKEMLMSSYYDLDKIRYKDKIVELGTELYASDAPAYYRGQAIREIALTYAANGNPELAEKWVLKSVPIFHSMDILYSEIAEGDELLSHVSFCTYWFFNHLFYMASSIGQDEAITKNSQFRQDVYQTVAQLYEILYKNDDMSFESLHLLYLLHQRIAKLETGLECREETIRTHLERAAACVIKSVTVEEHTLSHPLLTGWHIEAAPSDNLQWVRQMQKDLEDTCFDGYRDKDWFAAIASKLKAV